MDESGSTREAPEATAGSICARCASAKQCCIRALVPLAWMPAAGLRPLTLSQAYDANVAGEPTRSDMTHGRCKGREHEASAHG